MSIRVGRPAMAGKIAGPAPAAPAELDEALIQEIARRNQLAMRTLFVRHQVRIFRFILRMVRDRGVAEDVLSETFLDVWRQAGRFQARSTVSTWILGIARHKALTALQARPLAQLDGEVMSGIADPALNPEAKIVASDRAATLRRCLCALSPEHSEILDLAYYQEKSIGEVAGILGLPVNTVKTRMFYARKRLAALLAAENVE